MESKLNKINNLLKKVITYENVEKPDFLTHFKKLKDNPDTKVIYEYFRDIVGVVNYHEKLAYEYDFLSSFGKFNVDTGGHFENVFAIILGKIPFDQKKNPVKLNPNGYLNCLTFHDPHSEEFITKNKFTDVECLKDEDYVNFFDLLISIFLKVQIKKNYDNFNIIYKDELDKINQCISNIWEKYPGDPKHRYIFSSILNYMNYSGYNEQRKQKEEELKKYFEIEFTEEQPIKEYEKQPIKEEVKQPIKEYEKQPTEEEQKKEEIDELKDNVFSDYWESLLKRKDEKKEQKQTNEPKNKEEEQRTREKEEEEKKSRTKIKIKIERIMIEEKLLNDFKDKLSEFLSNEKIDVEWVELNPDLILFIVENQNCYFKDYRKQLEQLSMSILFYFIINNHRI
jgi:hypothetical protein